MKTTTVKDLTGLKQFAGTFAQDVWVSGDSSQKLIMLLHGPMGVGKTQFTKFLLEALGSNETVSPSFALHNSYETAHGIVDHLDLYRLESADDLESIGFWDLFDADRGFVILEWSERLKEFGLDFALPRIWKKLNVTLAFGANADERMIEIS